MDDKDILLALGEITATQKLQQEALKDISDTCKANTETLIRNTEHLEYHIKRTDIIEEKHEGFMMLVDKRLDELEAAKKAKKAFWAGLRKLSVRASILTGIVTAVLGAIMALVEAITRILG